MSVEINLPPVLQAMAGDTAQISVNGETVGACLGALVKQYPPLEKKLFNKKGKLPAGINIFVNGENAYPEPLARAVKPGDKIYISYIVLGG
ncbi:MAG: MoaD/ThiS family protein [Dehalococcoidales bacterium]|jgi:molybdopterin converting factor small subunit